MEYFIQIPVRANKPNSKSKWKSTDKVWDKKFELVFEGWFFCIQELAAELGLPYIETSAATGNSHIPV